MLMHIFPLIDALHNTCHFLKPHRSPNLTNRLFICRLHPDLKLYQSRTHRLNQLQFFFIQQIRRHFKMKIRDPFVMLLDIFPNGNRMLMITVKSSIHKLHLRHFLIDKKLKLRFADLLKRGGELTRDFLRYGLPIMGGQVVWSVNMLGQTMILGRYDAGVIAAVSIANMLHNMMYIAMNGLSSAVGIITGKTVGSGRMDKIREYSRTTQVIFLGLGILSGIAVHFLRDPFIGLYGASDAAVAYAREFINVISVTIIGTCYQAACLFGLVKSGGDISFVFRNDTIFVFLVVLPSAIIASYLGAPPWVVFACLKCDQILKCFVAVVKINRYNWMKNLTRETNEV